MPHTDIIDLVAGDTVQDFYLVKKKQIRKTKSGKDYLDLTLQDRTGTVSAKVWDDAPALAELFNEGDIIKIQADITTYNEKIDLKIFRLRKQQDGDAVKTGDFVPVSPYDPADMEKRLRVLLASIENPHLKALLDTYLSDDAFMERFCKGTASKFIHHPYQGGLLEHTLSVLEILDYFSGHYDGLNRDILLTGGFLHDLGKLIEISDGPEMNYTDDGILLGHMFLGARDVHGRISSIDGFPQGLATEILHTILSHQGQPDWGSPVVPMTREALIIHFTDNMDAKQFVAMRALEQAQGDSTFTEKIYPLNRPFFRRDKRDD